MANSILYGIGFHRQGISSVLDIKNKLIYIHMSKTGGSSVNALLIDPRLGIHDSDYKVYQLIQADPKIKQYFPGPLGMHSSFDDYREYLDSAGVNIKDFTVFTIIRNPWERVVSHYFYKTETLGKKLPPFNKFLKSSHPYRDKVLKGFDLFCGSAENIDHILRFENLSAEFNALSAQLGLGVAPLPQTNKSVKSRSYEELYNKKTRAIVADAFRYEVEQAGYRFRYGLFSRWF